MIFMQNCCSESEAGFWTNNNDQMPDIGIIMVWGSAEEYDPAQGRLFTWLIKLARKYLIAVTATKGSLKELKFTYSKLLAAVSCTLPDQDLSQSPGAFKL
jgi:hypothetical protein